MRPPRVNPSLKHAALVGQMLPVFISPCQVTQVSPLLITLNGTPNIPATKIAGATYSLGAANALFTNPGIPIVLPIG